MPIQLADQRIPMPLDTRPIAVLKHPGLFLDLLHHLLWREISSALPRCLRGNLDVAGVFQVVQLLERVLDTDARGEQTMIAQDHHALVAQVRHQPLALAQILSNALITVMGHAPGNAEPKRAGKRLKTHFLLS